MSCRARLKRYAWIIIACMVLITAVGGAIAFVQLSTPISVPPPPPPPTPTLSQVRDWSIVATETTTLLPGCVDIGIRINHDPINVWIFAIGVKLADAARLFARIGNGSFTLAQIMATPFYGQSLIKATRYELPASIMGAPTASQESICTLVLQHPRLAGQAGLENPNWQPDSPWQTQAASACQQVFVH